ncbi:MATE family efflux transporter [Thaumasiovibrio subtropicus]|uniref:MATE family efflux transporter n=1 Tax=Thaumasiovibrio subtropicus TaxID=1891207 RepID=UPI000B36152B|nr:MATE family efflux transporter [Thaumasiovibrio subtropicus]
MSEQNAKFLTGSTMRHIVVMSSTGAVGIMALFLVDLADMFFISLLGEAQLAAAIGFAGGLVFFSTSVSIGCSIAVGALLSKAIGAGEEEKLPGQFSSSLAYTVLVSVIVTTLMLLNLDTLLQLLGAEGRIAALAKSYLYILMPSAPFVAMSMASSAAMRAKGDAKRSMYATLVGGGVNAVFDPIFIFVLDMNVQGAAVASVVARVAMFLYCFAVVRGRYQLFCIPSLSNMGKYIGAISAIAIPAIIANTATPIGNAIVTRAIAPFGEDAVAGYAVIGRILPVSFALIFALSGAIGPIVGQNFGAHRIDRVGQALKDAMLFVGLYCIAVAAVLYVAQDSVSALFSLSSQAASIVGVFCTYVAITFIFNGALFVSNAAFNNLNRPTYSTMLNMGKATLGTLPFVYVGAQWYGAEGVLLGQAVGSVVFGILALYLVNREVARIGRTEACRHAREEAILEPDIPLTPFCSAKVEQLDDTSTIAER